jgi:hypothetical protein
MRRCLALVLLRNNYVNGGSLLQDRTDVRSDGSRREFSNAHFVVTYGEYVQCLADGSKRCQTCRLESPLMPILDIGCKGGLLSWLGTTG